MLKLYVAIDLMSCVHPYQNAHSGVPASKIISSLAPEWVRFHLQPELWIPSGWVASQVTQIIPVLLVDKKDAKGKYWRHQFHPKYKSGRKAHPDSIGVMRDAIIDQWKSASGAIEMQAGFEADDFIGDLCRSIGSNERVLMISVDSDWSQLVSDRAVWLDTYAAKERKHRDQRPAVLDIQQVIRRWNSYPDHNLPETYITNPREIAAVKHLIGDRSDAIPGGQIVPEGIIDLYYPTYRPTPIDRGNYNDSSQVQIPEVSGPGKPFWFFGLRNWSDYVLDYKAMTVLEIPHRDC